MPVYSDSEPIDEYGAIVGCSCNSCVFIRNNNRMRGQSSPQPCQCDACRANRNEPSRLPYRGQGVYVCEGLQNAQPSTTEVTTTSNRLGYTYIPYNSITPNVTIPYTEEQFGPSFAKKKSDVKIKRVNGVNVIEMNLKFRINL